MSKEITADDELRRTKAVLLSPRVVVDGHCVRVSAQIMSGRHVTTDSPTDSSKHAHAGQKQ